MYAFDLTLMKYLSRHYYYLTQHINDKPITLTGILYSILNENVKVLFSKLVLISRDMFL